jgi:hypothetical protein
VASTRSPGGLTVRVRVSLHTGEAQLRDGDYFGTTVNRAARLKGLAVGGQVVLSQATHQLVADQLPAGVTLKDLGRHALKGLTRDEQIFELQHPELDRVGGLAVLPFDVARSVAATVPLPRLLTRTEQFEFVGRAAERAILDSAWSLARSGERRVVLLAGEPGAGKTRLASEFAHVVHGDGVLVLGGRCDEGMGVPYQPFVEALRWHVDQTPDDQLAASLGRWPGELTRLVPEIAPRLPDVAPPLSSDPETERYRLFEAVASWLAVTALALVLDDLQWATGPTLLLLRHVARSDEVSNLLLVITYRDSEVGEELANLLGDLARGHGVERVPLGGLTESDVDALALAANVDGSEIHAAADGNPFFVGELLRHRAESSDGALPVGVLDVVTGRVRRLPDHAQHALRIAAVIGEEFDLPVLEAAIDLSHDDLVVALEQATSARLVTGRGTQYRFAHALVRDTLNGSVSDVRRTDSHRRVGEAIEATYEGALDGYLAALAQHFSEAGVSAKAADYASRAGDFALAQHANGEAIRLFTSALDLVDGGDAAARCDLLTNLAEAQRRISDAAHRDSMFDAAALAEQLGDGERLARAALISSWGVNDVNVDLPAIALFERALQLLSPADSILRSRAMSALGLKLALAKGDRSYRVGLSDAALAMARRVGDRATIGRVLADRQHDLVSGRA